MDYFGEAVAIGPGAAIAGAPSSLGKVGSAYIYRVPAPFGVDLSLGYSAGALSIGYTLSTLQSAAWSAQLVTGSGTQTVWSRNVGIINPPQTGTVPYTLAPQGLVTVKSFLTTANGSRCFDAKSVDTGAPAR